MSCTGEDTVDLGQDPLPLAVHVKPGETWSDSMVLIAVATDRSESPLAWPAAPVLQFGPGDSPIFTISGVLSDYTDPDTSQTTTNALAAWSMTAIQTALLASYVPARLLVEDQTWLEGSVDA